MIPCGRRGHRAGAVEVPQYDEVTGKEYWNCPKLASFDTSENGCSGSDADRAPDDDSIASMVSMVPSGAPARATRARAEAVVARR